VPAKSYPSDVSGDEWALVVPYLTLLPENAGQREHALREVSNGLRYVIKTGAPGAECRTVCRPGQRSTSRPSAGWRRVASRRWPKICAPYCAKQRDIKPKPMLPSWTAGHYVLRLKAARGPGMTAPSARRAPSCTWRLTRWASCWRCMSPPASVDNRAAVGRLAQAVQASTGQSVELTYVDQAIPTREPLRLLECIASNWK
jgi:hypothetical protein